MNTKKTNIKWPWTRLYFFFYKDVNLDLSFVYVVNYNIATICSAEWIYKTVLLRHYMNYNYVLYLSEKDKLHKLYVVMVLTPLSTIFQL